MKIRKRTDVVIFHHSLSLDVSVDEIRQWHLARKFEDIGYHAVIRIDGTIEHGRPLKYVGAHAFGRNWNSVGVCLTGDFFYNEPTVAQLEACQRYMHDLTRLYCKSIKIAFHRPQWFPNACPGYMMDRDDFLEVVSRGDVYLQEELRKEAEEWENPSQ